MHAVLLKNCDTAGATKIEVTLYHEGLKDSLKAFYTCALEACSVSETTGELTMLLVNGLSCLNNFFHSVTSCLFLF